MQYDPKIIIECAARLYSKAKLIAFIDAGFEVGLGSPLGAFAAAKMQDPLWVVAGILAGGSIGYAIGWEGRFNTGSRHRLLFAKYR